VIDASRAALKAAFPEREAAARAAQRPAAAE